ncbi:MAG: hypothetical protein Q7R39_16440, partial [Dehalococcoidia bacterium]|nr:hypothetical protein [Dehalococcoidia bacterium]
MIVRKRPADPAVVDSIAKDDRRRKITTIWADYDHLRSTQEMRLTDSIVLRKHPGSDAEANDIVSEYGKLGLTVVWDKDLER